MKTVRTPCPKCQNSGALSKDSDDLDCVYCGAAEQRAELARWVALNCRHMTPEQRDWAVHQRAIELAQLKEDAE